MRLAASTLAAGLAAGGALLAQQSAESLFSEANEYFRQANEASEADPQLAADLYRRAALRFESLVGERAIRNSKLYYNLGNAYFRLADIGRAILSYRIAQRLDPGDPDVERNLEYARTIRADRFDPQERRPVLETLLFWHYEFSLSIRLRIFAAAWLAFWGLLLLRRAGKDWVPREIAFGAGAAAALLLGSYLYEAVAAERSLAGVVVALETVARHGDGHSYDPAFENPLHAGVEFQVLEERPGWHRVELPDGRRCWLADEDIELVR